MNFELLERISSLFPVPVLDYLSQAQKRKDARLQV